MAFPIVLLLVTVLAVVVPSVSAQDMPAIASPEELRVLPVDPSFNDAQPIRTYGGVVWLPPQDLTWMEGFSATSAATSPDGSYQITFTNPDLVSFGIGMPEIAVYGTPGSGRYAQTSVRAEQCGAASKYCAQTGNPAGESFYDLSVNDGPAVAMHMSCCEGSFWAVMWYEPTTDMTTSFSMYLAPSDRLGAKGLDPAHRGTAQSLAEAASRFVPVVLTDT